MTASRIKEPYAVLTGIRLFAVIASSHVEAYTLALREWAGQQDGGIDVGQTGALVQVVRGCDPLENYIYIETDAAMKKAGLASGPAEEKT